MGRVSGKVALVTGGARGQGAEHVRLLAREGASVMITDILDEVGEKLAVELQGEGFEVEYLHLDVSQETEWQDVVQRTEQRFGQVTILVNNAGIVTYSDVENCTNEEWNRVIAINQTGTFLGMQAVVPAMKRSGGGSIVNVASIIGPMRGADGYMAYGASKAAVYAMTMNTAISHGKDGIRVNAIAPGALDTEMLREEMKHHGVSAAELVASTPLGRTATPDETSPAVLFLASDEASFITGVLLPVDGGVTLVIP